MTGYANTLTHNASVTLTIAGTTVVCKFSSGMTYTLGSATTSALAFGAASGTETLTSNGKTLGNVTMTGNSTLTLADNLLLGATATLTLTQGTFNANGKNVNIGLFASSNGNTRTVTMGSGTWTLTGNNATIWNVATSTNLTLTVGNAIVCNYSGNTGSRTISHTLVSEATTPSFNFTAGTDGISITGAVASLDFTGSSGTLANNTLSIYGSLTVSSGTVITAGANTVTFASTGSKTITSSGVTLDFPVTFNGSGGTWTLQDNLTVGSSRTVTHTTGTINANNNNFSMGLFAGSGTGTRTMTMGSGNWTMTGTGVVWTTATITNLTFNPNTSTLIISDTSATLKQFTTGGLTFNNITYSGDNIIVNDSHTVAIMSVNNAGLATGLKITSTKTVTLTYDFRTNGAPGSLAKLLSSSAGSAHNLTAAGVSQVCVDYMSIKDSAATSASWKAGNNSTNVSGNSGWVFSSCPVKNNPPVNNKKTLRGKRQATANAEGVAGIRGVLIRKFNIYTLISGYVSRFFHMFGR